jgi:hypothetical protein
MVKDFQLKGLQKLVNSSVIKDVYPMVERIDFEYDKEKQNKWKRHGHLDVNIFLNDPTITEKNMYHKEFDPHYLVEHHIKDFFPYFNIDNIVLDFIVWGPDGDIVTSWKH